MNQQSIRKYNRKTCGIEQTNPFLDLFGQTIVTHFDIYVWVCVITHARFLGRHYDWYVKNYCVVAKIEHCKRNEDWVKIVREYQAKYAHVYKEPCYSAH